MNEVIYVDLNNNKMNEAKSMKLNLESVTGTSRDLSVEISKISLKGSSKSYKPRETLIQGVSALVGEILKEEGRNPGSYLYRIMESASFTGQDIKYTSFKGAFDRVAAGGLIEVHKGFRDASKGNRYKGAATRLRGTSKLFELCAEHGITPANCNEHYKPRPRPVAVRNPIILKSSKIRQKTKKRKVIEGRSMPFDMNHPKVAKAWKQVEDLNRYFAGVSIDPDEHVGFQRIFNQGDIPGHNWQRGGRLYSIGGGYQMIKKEKRPFIRINKEATVEIDISGSFYTILHHLLGWQFPGGDPYAVPVDLPRDVIKAWVNMTLGHDNFHARWSKAVKGKYAKHNGGKDIQKDWPLRKVRDQLRPVMPIMEAWLASDIRWGALQFIESEIMVDTVWELATIRDIPALPIFDSIIVPASKEAFAKSVLSNAFHRHTGIRPGLKTKRQEG